MSFYVFNQQNSLWWLGLFRIKHVNTSFSECVSSDLWNRSIWDEEYCLVRVPFLMYFKRVWGYTTLCFLFGLTSPVADCDSWHCEGCRPPFWVWLGPLCYQLVIRTSQTGSGEHFRSNISLFSLWDISHTLTCCEEELLVQYVSDNRLTHRVFRCSLCAECCSPHTGCCLEHHTHGFSSANLNHHRLTTATRPSSHLKTTGNKQTNKSTKKTQASIWRLDNGEAQMSWKPTCPPRLLPPAAANLPSQLKSANTPRVFVM